MREGEDQERARNQPSGLGPTDLEAGRNAGGAGLAELLARVEKAEGPDRYADCWLACALDGFFPTIEEWPECDWGWSWRVNFCCYRDGGLVSPGHGGDQMVQPYTSSLDAALRLVERVLPGWAWMARGSGYVGDSLPFAKLWKPYAEPPGNDFDGRAKTPALAVLAALLKALIALPDPPVGA